MTGRGIVVDAERAEAREVLVASTHHVRRNSNLKPTRHVALRWAQRLERVFGIEIESCARCGARLKRDAGDDGRRRRHRALSGRVGQPIQGRWWPAAHWREAGRLQAAARGGWQGRLKVLFAFSDTGTGTGTLVMVVQAGIAIMAARWRWQTVHAPDTGQAVAAWR